MFSKIELCWEMSIKNIIFNDGDKKMFSKIRAREMRWQSRDNFWSRATWTLIYIYKSHQLNLFDKWTTLLMCNLGHRVCCPSRIMIHHPLFLEGMREPKTILNLIQEVIMIRNLFLLVLSQNKVKNKFLFQKRMGGVSDYNFVCHTETF